MAHFDIKQTGVRRFRGKGGSEALRKLQASESANAGAAYQAGLDELDW